jgi:hypothetical protein
LYFGEHPRKSMVVEVKRGVLAVMHVKARLSETLKTSTLLQNLVPAHSSSSRKSAMVDI